MAHATSQGSNVNIISTCVDTLVRRRLPDNAKYTETLQASLRKDFRTLQHHIDVLTEDLTKQLDRRSPPHDDVDK